MDARMLSRRPTPRGQQRGDILLVILIALSVCVLALVYSMRETITSSQIAGNVLTRQKEVQVSDAALKIVENTIQGMFNGQALELVAPGQPWWRTVTPGVGVGAPDLIAGYWGSCLGNANSTLTCGSFPVTINGTTLPYQVLAVVQPTGRADPNACNLGTLTAVYYDIYINISETSGASGATTETVYKLCVY